MYYLFTGVQWIAAVVEIVCFVLILIRMFQTGDSTLGIICLVLVLCVGIGGLLAFIMGWVNVRKYDARTIMLVWTVAFVVAIFAVAGSFATAPSAVIVIPQR